MELLLAFEASGSLDKLADAMAKDSSVISRNLQKLSQEFPVLIKASGRWRITPFGRQINNLSRQFLTSVDDLTSEVSKNKNTFGTSKVPEHSLLVVINAQKALYDPAQGRRSNSDAEKNIERMLEFWRKKKRPIIHVKHVSDNPASLFYRKIPGVDFIPNLSPKNQELIIEKSKASAFTGTNLQKLIGQLKTEALVLVGFTGGECIDATARQSSDLGFHTFVVGDATATFDIVGPKNKLHKADKVHKSTLAALHALFAEVLETDAIIR